MVWFLLLVMITMPIIRPFNALLPAGQIPASVVTRPLESYSRAEAKAIAAENHCSFLHLINPELSNSYLSGASQELISKKISENLDYFLKQQLLVKQDHPAMYIYRVLHDDVAQTGIWTLTAIEDYLLGKIKKHENTVEYRERLLAAYLQQTRLDSNPILITYPPQHVIEAITTKYVSRPCLLDFKFVDQSRHQLWAITSPGDLAIITSVFAQMPAVYIADGHHRIAAMAQLSKGIYFTTVYMNTKEVKVLEFNRLVRNLGGLSPEAFLAKISLSFDVQEKAQEVKPKNVHEIGMYFNRQWYLLQPKKELYDENDPVGVLDVSILQNYILGPVLSINDPRTDARIAFSGGRTPVFELQQQVDNGLFVVAFTLFPISVDQLIKVADSNKVLPPKSTWIEPKFLVGLVTHQFN